MINEYFTQLLYRDRGLDWFAEPLDIPVDDDIPFDLRKHCTNPAVAAGSPPAG